MSSPPVTRTQRLVLWIAILASFVSFLDSSVINVALPAISHELGGGITTQQWVVDAYLIALGSLILVAGSLSDLLGRIVVLRTGLIGFGATSVMCALAPTAEVLIWARALQGVAAALLVPSSLALITSNFDAAPRAKAIGQWTAGTTVAFIAGPLLGGVLVDSVGWRWVFGINVLPIAVTLYLLGGLRAKDVRKEGVRIDYPGAVLCALGLAGPVYALIEQGNYGWGSPLILMPFILGILCLAGFIWRQRTARQPLLLAVEHIAAHHAGADIGDAPGPRLGEMHVEGRAEAALGRVFDLDLAAVGRGHLDIVEPHRVVVEIEQFVRRRGVEGDPGIIARKHRRRRQHPLAMRLCGLRKRDGCERSGDEQTRFHDIFPL